MSQVDYDKKIQEINKLKISDAEKSRRIRLLMLQRKQSGEVKTATAAVNKPITMKVGVNKPNTTKASVIKPSVIKPSVRMADSNEPFHDQLHAIRRDESLSNEEKHAKIQALTENKPEINTAVVQDAIERIRQIHAIRKQNLQKMNKIKK